jgi:hypothetical protein
MNVDATNAATVATGVKNGKPAECGSSTVRKSASIANIAAAMCKAQAELKNPPKASDNPHFKSKFADLATVRDTVTPVLSRHKLAVMQFPCDCDGMPALTTILTHESGEWIETTILLRSKMDPQGIGSGITYARRYALQSICGVAGEDDDDANAAQPAPRQQQAAPPKDNLELRGKAEIALRGCGDRAMYLAVCKQLNEDRDAGKFSRADLDYLSGVSREINAKFPAPKQTA